MKNDENQLIPPVIDGTMSFRQRCAITAMHAIASKYASVWTPFHIAKEAYAIADAMVSSDTITEGR